MVKTKRIISVLLTIAMLVTCMSGFAISVYAANFAVDKVVECEDGKLSSDVKSVTSKDASGGKYIMVEESGGRINDPAAEKGAYAKWTFDIPSDGTYLVFARVLLPTGNNDSFHYRWDSENWQTIHPGEQTSWTWIQVGKAGTTLKAGTHTFEWIPREKAGMFDAIFVTTDASKVPSNPGGLATPPPATPVAKPTATANTDSSTAKTFETKDGMVMIELEDITLNKEMFGLVDQKAASGGKGITPLINSKVLPDVSAKAGAEFNVKVDKSGTYSLFLRYTAKNDGNDSGYWSANGAAFKNIAYSPLTGDDESNFNWIKVNIGVSALSAGSTLNLRILPREAGAVLDKIILITGFPAYIPSGLGELPKPGEVTEMILPDDAYPKPTITPPAEHPRLLFTAKDIPTIKANWEKAQNQNAYKAFQDALNNTSDGNLKAPNPGKSNHNAAILNAIEAWAFDYVINGNEENGKKAVSAIKNYIATCVYDGLSDNCRAMGLVIFTASEVYDWCYPLISDQDKKIIRAACEGVASGMEIGYPPSRQGAVVGHGSEAQLMRDLLSFGIATYDERPDIYNYCAGRFLSEYIEPRNFWYKSHTQHQGDAYGPYRFQWDMWAAWIMKRMSGVDIFEPDMGKAPYEWLYNRRPDGQVFRNGDCYNESGNKNSYWTGYSNSLFYASNYYNDPVLKREFTREVKQLSSFNMSPVQFLVMNNPDLGGEPVGTLPLTKYFGSPNGTMVARTGWNDGLNAPDAIGVMKIGEYWGGNHNHLDAGSFQLYYKGILASESGFYESYGTPHDGNYNKRTIAHNSLLIYDPDEQMGIYAPKLNDGGQRFPNNGTEPATMEVWMNNGYQTGTVLDHDFGPDPMEPAYSYIKGDITKAYSEKVDGVVRSMVFLPLEDPDHPAAMIVMDKVDSAKAEFKKTFLLHMQQEPTVSGNKTTIVRDTDGYNGKMVNETLLPKEAKIEKIGGEGSEFMVAGQNLAPNKPISSATAIEAGWGRVEISPAQENKTDYFLNVMTVSDADSAAADIDSTLIEGENYVGAVLSDRVAIFSKDASRMDKEIKFTIPGSGNFKVFVGGIREGTWTVSSGEEVIVTQEGGAAFFSAPAGEVTLTYQNSNANRTTAPIVKPELEGISIRINNNFIYTDVPPTIKDDRTLVPLRAIFEAIDAEVAWDEATLTATAKKGTRVVTVSEDSNIATIDSEQVELDVPPQRVNDRFLVPIRFVTEAFGCTVDWDDFSQTVDIKYTGQVPQSEYPPKMGVPNSLTVYKITQSGEDADGNGIAKSLDGDLATRWAVEGTEESAWGIYDLGSVKALDSVYLAFYNGNTRVYTFSIEVSEDGNTYTKVLTKKESSGKTNEMEKYDLGGVKARYVKYSGAGNTANMWNSMTEIAFVEKK